MYAVEGLAGWDVPEPFRVEVKAVERRPRLTILRMVITNPTRKPQTGHFASDRLRADFADFRLLDAVNGRHYTPLRENDRDGQVFGTRHGSFTDDFEPGVPHPVEIYFPPLPPETKTVTVAPTTQMGPLTGIPVTQGAADPVSKPGDPWQVVAPQGQIWEGAWDVEELVETPERTTKQDGSTETIGLRTDVLFAFDKATLNPKATAVLDEVVEETRRRADPAKPPVIVTGHTDSKGDDSYNQQLSVRRAESVTRYLQAKLGTDYQYKTDGKGETQPVAPNEQPGGADNPEGRALNRRVDISYTIKQEKPGATTTEPAVGDVRGSVLPPAPFRASPGEAVTSFEHGGKYKVDVLPAFRDGAYLVISFDVTALVDNVPIPGPFEGWVNDFVQPSSYGAITVVDPATQARYFPIRWAENQIHHLAEGQKGRAYVYFPAPPDDRTSITLQVQGGQTVPEVPIARWNQQE
ncbi:OmpA family protein [Nonomuraea sp. NPDC049646]|uniref:OmpA family protein n=1 Tax=unclassified Nonomuraea TaxID=2593643 RepID=UPI0037AAFD45